MIAEISKSETKPSPALSTSVPAQPSTFRTLFPYPTLLIAAGIAILTVLVYFRTTTHPFVVYDDDEYIYQHDRVMAGLTLENIWWSLTGVHSSNWHPLTWLSHMLDWQLFADNAGGHHLTSILLHAVTAVGLLFALWRLTGELWPSAVVAAVFALHPLRVESVAWVAERKDVLSGFCFVFALRAYARYVEAPSLGRYLAVAGLFVLGLMSKPMVVTLPCVLLLLDYWPLRRFEAGARFWQLCREKIPLFAIGVASSLITMNAQSRALETGDSVSLAQRIPNAIVSYQDYIVQSVYPVEMAVFYPHPKGTLPTWKVAVASLGLLTVTSLAIFLRRRAPYFLVGWFWYLGMLVPVIGVIQVGWQARADRYMYLPQVGLVIAIVWGIKDGLRLPRPVLLAAAVVILGAFAIQSWRQTAYWRDSETLFTHALACTGPNVIGHHNLGTTLMTQGRRAEAIEHYRKALELSPDNVLTKNNLTGAYTEIGLEAVKRQDYDQAIVAFRTALDFTPSDSATKRNLALAYFHRGKGRVIQKRLTEGLADFQQAVEADPDYAACHSALGGTLFDLGRYDEAIPHFRRTLALNPKDALAERFLRNAIQKSNGGK